MTQAFDKMMNRKQQLRVRWAFIALLIATIGVAAASARKIFFFGVAVHDTVEIINPELGPNELIKHTEDLAEIFSWLFNPLLGLLALWILGTAGIVVYTTRKKGCRTST